MSGDDVRVLPTCFGCIYWKPESEDVPPDSGRCRRFPPQRDPEYAYGQYSLTRGTDWCGEHKGFTEWVTLFKRESAIKREKE